MKEKSFQEAIGFSVKDTLALFWLHETNKSSCYSVEIYDRFTENFPGRKVGYEYVARVAKNLEVEGALSSQQEKRKVFYNITAVGKKRLSRYEEVYYERFHEIVAVLNRFYYELTKNGEKPAKPSHPLPEEFRAYFSKLISVKDAVRYIAFRLGQKRTIFSMADVAAQLDDLFGWSPSNSYLYTVSSELEEKGYLIGEWPDEKRTKRHLRSTDAANEFSRQIATDLTAQITTNRRFLIYMLQFLRQSK